MTVFLRILSSLLCCLVFSGQLCGGAWAEEAFETPVPYAVILDSRSGEIYYQKGARLPIQPGNMTKIMTMAVVLEALRSGRFSREREVVISPHAWRRGGAPSGGTTMYAAVGSRVPVRDLLKGMAIDSANDAVIALAEALEGSEEGLAHRMTDRARELGLIHTYFVNPTGAAHPDHRTTVYDLAQMARYLIEAFPEDYTLYQEPSLTWNGIFQKNRNPLLGSYPGADGVTTGYLAGVGHGMVASALRHGRRLIVALHGAKDPQERTVQARRLLDFGFRHFKLHTLFLKNQIVGRARVWGGRESWVKLVVHDPVRMMLSQKDREQLTAELVYQGPVSAPVKQGQSVGMLKLFLGHKNISKIPLYAESPIEKDTRMLHNALDSFLFMVFGG